jgi:hypothetical protein
VAACQHPLSKVLHQRLGLEVEIAQHLVAPPTSQHSDGVGVNIGTKQRHGPSDSERLRTDISRCKSESWAKGHNGGAESGCDVGGSYIKAKTCRKVPFQEVAIYLIGPWRVTLPHEI